jgi:poly(3-hydroxyalkanoate) synthetase
MKELHDERLDIPVLSVCSVVCDVQMIEVIRKESMVTVLDPMRLDFILTRPRELAELARKRFEEFEQLYLFDPCERSITD